MRIKFLHILLIMSVLSLALNAQDYDQLKQSMNPPPYVPVTMPAGFELTAPAATSLPQCFIEPDSTHIPVTFDLSPTTPGTGCDDCHSETPIALPFIYDICGTQWDEFWVNSNGNITFDNFYTTFTPVGIPNNSTAIMIAPFWADVDLRSCGNVYYKVTPTHAIITWDSVGYYSQNCDLFNTFQVVLTDGMDPIIGVGNNTAFYYKNMDWTTGDVTGAGGFGGAPAQIGLNANDGVLFDLIGAFDIPGVDAPVLDAYDMTISTGGVDWLDYQCFEFPAGNCDIAACSITDPIAFADTCIGGVYNLFVTFDILDPGTNYTVSVDGGVPLTFNYDLTQASQTAFISGITEPGTPYGTVTIADDTDSTCVVTFDYLIPNCQACFELIELVVPTELCNGDTLGFEAYADIGAINVTWTDPSGNPVSPSDVVVYSDCDPSVLTYTVDVVCAVDPNIVYTETFDVTLYPTDVSSYISIDAECDVNVTIDPSCTSIYILNQPTIVPGTDGSDVVSIAYNNNPCLATFDVPFDYDCAQCIINTANLSVEDCDGETFTVAINVDGVDLGATYSVLDQDGNDLGSYNYNSDVVLGPFDGDGSTSYTFTITDSYDNTCVYTESFDAPLCIDCSINSISVVNGDCSNGEYSATIDVDAFDNGSSFTINDATGAAYGTYNYADLPVTIGPFFGDGSTDIDFTLVDDLSTDCSQDFTVAAQNCYVCDIDNVVFTTTCTSLTNLDISLSFTGSNVYTISDGTTVWNNVSAGSDIYLGSYPENADVVITITDELALSCSYTSDAINVDCDCNSVGGTIMVNSMNVCPDDLSIVDADDFLLEPGQSVYYLYHNQPVVEYSNLPNLVTDVYTTGSFLTNNGSVIPCGGTVYVTAIGAYEDTAMPGFPDYDDFCLTVSNTIPVNFLCPIVITVDEICDNTVGEFTYTFMVSGGLPSVIPGEEYTISGDNFTGVAGLSGSVVVGPIPDLTSYTITATDANGCSGTVTQNVECEKVPVELLSFTGNSLESGNILNWSTASEIENDYFTLLSSQDAETFKVISQIDGAGNSSSENKYDYLDTDAGNGITYYRLAQTDWDGTYTELSTIAINRTEGSDGLAIQSINPVPARDYVNIIVSVDSASDGFIQLMDVSGKVIQSSAVSLSTGSNEIILNVEMLSTGMYMAELVTNDNSVSQKIIIE